MPDMIRAQPLDLDAFATHVAVEPGKEIRLTGSYRTKDGAVVDAATTSWPEGTPGGNGIDAGGLVDFKGGGFHVASRDPITHEVVAVATGGAAPACALAGVEAPCLPLRTVFLARSRFMTRDELRESMNGAISYELVAPPPPPPVPVYAPVRDAVTSPIAIVTAAIVAIAAALALGLVVRRRRAESPEGRMRALASRVERKLRTSDAALSAALAPVMKRTLEVLSSRRVDPRGPEGRRVAEVLVRVEQRIDETAREARAAEEQQAADELVAEMETALEAARETAAI